MAIVILYTNNYDWKLFYFQMNMMKMNMFVICVIVMGTGNIFNSFILYYLFIFMIVEYIYFNFILNNILLANFGLSTLLNIRFCKKS